MQTERYIVLGRLLALVQPASTILLWLMVRDLRGCSPLYFRTVTPHLNLLDLCSRSEVPPILLLLL
jgi:hypothetical protein